MLSKLMFKVQVEFAREMIRKSISNAMVRKISSIKHLDFQ